MTIFSIFFLHQELRSLPSKSDVAVTMMLLLVLVGVILVDDDDDYDDGVICQFLVETHS